MNSVKSNAYNKCYKRSKRIIPTEPFYRSTMNSKEVCKCLGCGGKK